MIETLRGLTKEQRYAVIDIVAVALCAAFIFGYGLKVVTDKLDRPTGNSVNTWLDGQSPEAQYDFLDARLTPEIRRAIAEHWCLQNPNTVRVCHNATIYSRPVK